MAFNPPSLLLLILTVKMFEMEQNRERLPSPQPLKMDSSHDTTAEDRVPQIEQHPKMLSLQQVLEMKSNRGPTIIARAPMTRANWVNALWADISGQLRRFAVISHDLFDGLLLKRDTDTGLLIFGELRKKYEQLGNERNLASVRVLTPERLTGGMWQLLWTIKRHRDPNGRQFHSQTTIDPINQRAYLEVDSNPGQPFSVASFSLPAFIQDYGPGPSEFDPEPEDEFDAVMRGIMTDVDAGTCVRE